MKLLKEIHHFDLHLDLKNFGLNPKEWRILADNHKLYRIESKEDQSFAFLGQAIRKGHRIQWKNLHLISL